MDIELSDGTKELVRDLALDEGALRIDYAKLGEMKCNSRESVMSYAMMYVIQELMLMFGIREFDEKIDGFIHGISEAYGDLYDCISRNGNEAEKLLCKQKICNLNCNMHGYILKIV